MAQRKEPRGVAVLDIGSTNVKLSLFDSGLKLLDEKSTGSRWVENVYLSIDLEPVLSFARNGLEAFDRIAPVDVIVPVSHGSALALLDELNNLALPIMAYEAQPPERVCGAYARIEPEFEEVFAPTNPGALTLGRQLLWQQMHFANAFSKVRTIVPLAQYAAYRLCGHLATEVSALGAQTHLWDPVRRHYSSMARSQGWANLFAPLAPAWTELGSLTEQLPRGRGEVLVGVHDSNANFVRYLRLADRCLVSTGTWIIAFDPAVTMESLNPAADQVSNTTIFGDPVACCRFMGGREHSVLSNGVPTDDKCGEIAARLVQEGVMALPAFSNSGGPLPGAGGKGHICGGPVTSRQRAVLASMYCGQMTALALDRMGASKHMIVDGPFAGNRVFCAVLAACRGGSVAICRESNGTALGAAMLAHMRSGITDKAEPALEAAQATPIPGLDQYHKHWLACAGVDTPRQQQMI